MRLREFLGNVTEGSSSSAPAPRNAVKDSQHGSTSILFLWDLGKSPSSKVSQTCGPPVSTLFEQKIIIIRVVSVPEGHFDTENNEINPLLRISSLPNIPENYPEASQKHLSMSLEDAQEGLRFQA